MTDDQIRKEVEFLSATSRQELLVRWEQLHGFVRVQQSDLWVALLEAMGEALLCSPFFSSVVLGANTILCVASEAQKEALLPSIAEGRSTATLALCEAAGHWSVERISTTARADGDGYVLDGTKTWVIDGHTSDLLLVAARKPGTTGADGIAVFAVPGQTAGIERTLAGYATHANFAGALVVAGVVIAVACLAAAAGLFATHREELGRAIESARRAPAWLVAALPITAPAGRAIVSDGWKTVGRIEVESETGSLTLDHDH